MYLDIQGGPESNIWNLSLIYGVRKLKLSAHINFKWQIGETCDDISQLLFKVTATEEEKGLNELKF